MLIIEAETPKGIVRKKFLNKSTDDFVQYLPKYFMVPMDKIKVFEVPDEFEYKSFKKYSECCDEKLEAGKIVLEDVRISEIETENKDTGEKTKQVNREVLQTKEIGLIELKIKDNRLVKNA